MEATAHKSGTELQMTGLSVVMYGDPVHIWGMLVPASTR
jgi:hypothetical protein